MKAPSTAELIAGKKTSMRLGIDQRQAVDSMARRYAAELNTDVHSYMIVQACLSVVLGVPPSDPTALKITTRL